MAMKNKVIWQEGLFIQPQHFQQQQRFNDYQLATRLTSMAGFAWGFSELSINQQHLLQGKIVLDKAVGCMPDGTVFSLPDQDVLPVPYQPVAFDTEESRTLYLALPVNHDAINEIAGRHSTGQGNGRYRLNYTDVRDQHTDEGNAIQLALGQLLPHIVTGAEDLSSFTTLPLCRILARDTNGSLLLDSSFIPTCQTIKASQVLTSFLEEVQETISNRTGDLAKRIGSPEQSGIADVAEFMMLQMLNRSQGRFSHRKNLSVLHPETLYLDLAELLGELMTFTSAARIPCEYDVYNHHDLTTSFHRLLLAVRRELGIVLRPRALNLPLSKNEGIYQATINDMQLLQDASFVLAVYAQTPHDQLLRQFVQQSKVSSPEKIRNMVSVQVPGIQLRPLSSAPRQLPFHANYIYFSLDKTGKEWADVAVSGAIALHVSGTFPALDMQLWAVRG
ncbi:type VI secretion system baseplate subunit TssK [Citrobacter sp. FP75]|uniref:type VI secretion system baseplate subunit TssK n=1 Tax=Citrobacter sp. FP75 TaxID=1852949 RepID=UPI001BC8D764|nr:type VI secretion system baseplate subunit TssK [Citrobacter sp. FP75]